MHGSRVEGRSPAALANKGADAVDQPLVLVVDDDEIMRLTAHEALCSAGFRVVCADTGERGLAVFDELYPDVVLLDVKMPGMDGFETCARLRASAGGRHTPILMMTGLDDLASIERAFEAGATDFELKPVNWLVTMHRIGYMQRAATAAELDARHREMESRRLRSELNDLRRALQKAQLCYCSPQMDAVMSTARRVAPTDATVLISGESGTGKELVARTVHELSSRRKGPRVVVDCGAIPKTLIESELFGHEKGAFTGAAVRRVGRLAEANRGTLFLDEIAELPLELQSKLLRFVQERQLRSIGGSKPIDVDVRILVATNRNLAAEVKAGRFREDLYYRLNVINLRIPPLRERPDDVLHLAHHFLAMYTSQYQKENGRYAPGVERALLAYSWPGNVRELQNRILQAVILCEGPVLTVEDLKLDSDRGSVSETPRRAVPAHQVKPAFAPSQTTPFSGRSQSAAKPESVEAQLALLRTVVGSMVEELNGAAPPQSIGRWLSRELVTLANQAAGGVASRGARLAGLAETTFRRRLAQAERLLDAAAGVAPEPESWERARGLLRGLIAANQKQGSDLLDEVGRVLLIEVLQCYPGQVKRGAALLGVSAPTYRRRVADLQLP